MKKRLWSLLILSMLVIFSACNGEKEQSGAVSSSAIDTKAKADGLKDAYKDDFTVGVSINTWQLADSEQSALIRKHFNICTMENELKPENTLDWEGSVNSKDGMPAIKKEHLDKILSLVSSNNLKLHGHTLIWHSQTPEWFFCKNYEPSDGRVDKKTMLARMESYMKQILTYCEEKYPGVIYAWDVVNEAMADGGGFREDSPWYEIIGEEYFEKAFEIARKYAGEKVKLFYNDYNEYIAAKRDFIFAKVKLLAEKKLVDGIGMQSHWDMDYPSADLIGTAARKYSQIEGIEVQLTEIDMHCNDNSEEAMKKQAERYREIFEMLLNNKKEGRANVTNVTFWGLDDGVTWLTNFRQEQSYPLLFDKNRNPKLSLESLLELGNES